MSSHRSKEQQQQQPKHPQQHQSQQKPSSSSRDRLKPSSAATAGSTSTTSTPSTSTPRDRSDNRSLLSTTRSIAPISSSGSTTSALTASPSTFTIGRSPSGNVYDPQGGAAARLRRVASGASIAASIRSMTPAKKQEQQGDKRRQEQASAISTIAHHEQVESNCTDQEPPPGSSPSPLPQQQGTKRIERAADESGLRAASRRKTWFGWASNPDDPDVPKDTSAHSGTQVNAQAGPSKQPSQSNEPTYTTSNPVADTLASKDLAKPTEPNDDQPPQPQDTTPSHTSDQPNQDTLKPRKTIDSNPRTRTVSWFGWRLPQEVQDTRQVSAPESHSDQHDQHPPEPSQDSDVAMAQASEDPANERHTQQPSSEQAYPPAHSAPQQPTSSWIWGLWGRPAPQQSAEQGQDVQMSEPDPPAIATESSSPLLVSNSNSNSAWTAWIPYWPAGTSTDEGPPATASSDAQPPPLTPAEQVKAEALARPDPSPTSLPLSTSDAVLNPATRSSWISYFSSRSARPPAKVDAGEPEVMEVDFNESSADQTRDPIKDATLKAPPVDKNKAKAFAIPSSLRAASQPTSLQPSRPASPRPGTPQTVATAPAPKPDPAPPASRPTTPLTGKATTSKKDTKKAVAPPAPRAPPVPNLVLPTFEDTFFSTPRNISPPAGVLKRTLSAVNTWLGGGPSTSSNTHLRTAPRIRGRNPFQSAAGPVSSSALSTSPSTTSHTHSKSGSSTPDVGLALAEEAASRLPRSWETIGHRTRAEKQGCDGIRRVCIVALHGWFAQSWASRFMGEPTGTSVKFAMEMRDAVLRHFRSVEGMELNAEAITMIPLSADGTVQDRTDRSFAALLNRQEWVQHLAQADAIFFACHSQGCVVGTNLLARLIEQNYINARKTRIALLGMCGIHSGPFEHLRSTVVGSYVNYFETAAAKELFEFQKPTSNVSRQYEASLKLILDAGTKVLWVASTDDQVVPLHSALFTAAQHPSILRALYIHGATFPKLDFLTNMLTFCVVVRNAGLSDHDLLALLSASVAGSLYGGLGHSLCYEEPRTYDLAVSYLLRTTHPLSTPTTRADESHPPKLHISPIESRRLHNPHLLPWSLRGILEDRAVRAVFADEMNKLLDDFESWRPVTKTLRDVQYRLEPMRSVPRPEGRGEETQTSADADATKGSGTKSSKL